MLFGEKIYSIFIFSALSLSESLTCIKLLLLLAECDEILVYLQIEVISDEFRGYQKKAQNCKMDRKFKNVKISYK
jgi:hypothetical protein